jgi:NAD-dependent DNA ligase
MGGINGRGMTKKTDFLIVGVNSGSKLAKAKALGTAIIGEKEFLAVYG